MNGTAVQPPVTPRRQESQLPQEIWNGTTTLSPGRTAVTSAPTATTSATPSCPNGYGPASGNRP